MFNIKQRANLINSIKNEKVKGNIIDIENYIENFVDKKLEIIVILLKRFHLMKTTDSIIHYYTDTSF